MSNVVTESEYQELDAVALAGLLANKKVSPIELMVHATNLARTRGATFNAICIERYDESLKIAAEHELTGVFQGVPFLLKDSGLASKRFPMRVGSNLFKDSKAHRNSTLTDRFEAAGLIPFARTTTPEFCMAPATEATINGGPTLNPWNTAVSCGGSSGGAAVAVATRVVPIAHGSDGGGSIRIPASCCGIFGLKPTRGRVPTGSDKGEIWGGLAIDGVLSRTVRDSAAAIDAIGGRADYSAYGIAPMPETCMEAIQETRCIPLRIGVWRDAWNGIPIAPECQKAVQHAANLCADLGHIVIDTDIPHLDYEQFFENHRLVLASHIAHSVHNHLLTTGRDLSEGDLEPAIFDGYLTGKALTASQYIEAIEGFHNVARVMQSSMEDYDLLITPSLTQLPVPVGYLSMDRSFYDLRSRIAQYATFMAVFNASGQPAASIPLHWTNDNIPVGVQVVAKFGREDLIFKLASQLERSSPWIDRSPSFKA